MNMVEKVARAIRRGRFIRTGRIAAFNPDEPLTENEMNDARAAIEAMRPATMPVLLAMINTLDDDGGELHRRKWEAAIDASLKETPDGQ